jgi:hypothetical protein
LGPSRRLSRQRRVPISRSLHLLKRIPNRPEKLPKKPRRKQHSPGARDGGHDASAVANRRLKFQTKKTARRKPGGF